MSTPGLPLLLVAHRESLVVGLIGLLRHCRGCGLLSPIVDLLVFVARVWAVILFAALWPLMCVVKPWWVVVGSVGRSHSRNGRHSRRSDQHRLQPGVELLHLALGTDSDPHNTITAIMVSTLVPPKVSYITYPLIDQC